jgi:hypothetical protein
MQFIREIYPYLVAKKKQAILAYTFLTLQQGLPSKKKGYLPEQIEQREILVEKIQQANRGIYVELPDWTILPPTLFEEGFYLRQDIIWCLSGGTWLYTRTQKGDMPMMIRDMARLNPATVQLWNGEKWTRVQGFSKSKRRGDELELVLRSGERISCTPTHKFPTNRGLLEAKDIKTGDWLEVTRIPEPESPRDTNFINEDIAWFVGLYIAEGSKSNDCIQIAGHSKEEQRWLRLNKIAHNYGGYITRTINGNKMDIRLYGKILNSFLDEFVSGKTAKDKGLSPSCWKYSNVFLRAILDGYLSGDGAWDEKNKRWRIGFTRNYNLERDLRTLSARLGFNLTLNLSNSFIGEKKYPSFRGEIKFEATTEGHWNQKNKTEIIKIQKARCREVYDIGVSDEPHLFALASGILTHNSKPNPMPESVTDRCTKSHEYIFLLTKSARYYYDNEAIGYNIQDDTIKRYERGWNGNGDRGFPNGPQNHIQNFMDPNNEKRLWANKKSVWTINTKPYKEAHFATFPPEIPRTCILAGSKKGDTILDPFCGSGTTGEEALKLGRSFIGIELNQKYVNDLIIPRLDNVDPLFHEAL